MWYYWQWRCHRIVVGGVEEWLCGITGSGDVIR